MSRGVFQRRLRDVFAEYADGQIDFLAAKLQVFEACADYRAPYLGSSVPDDVLTECFNMTCEFYRRAYEYGDLSKAEFEDLVQEQATEYFLDPDACAQHRDEAFELIQEAA